uniref:Uncharacterized protein n=1 Tax=Zea mays TaxID=4577 RepID=A0A804Q937_MAIZE|eukprot:XP_020396780.1 uncharacterized protein LOC109940854 [Zea mays]
MAAVRPSSISSRDAQFPPMALFLGHCFPSREFPLLSTSSSSSMVASCSDPISLLGSRPCLAPSLLSTSPYRAVLISLLRAILLGSIPQRPASSLLAVLWSPPCTKPWSSYARAVPSSPPTSACLAAARPWQPLPLCSRPSSFPAVEILCARVLCVSKLWSPFPLPSSCRAWIQPQPRPCSALCLRAR